MSSHTVEERVDSLLKELMKRQNRKLLESYRFRGSSNRVYRIPLNHSSSEFVVVKLLPGRMSYVKGKVKRILRNWIYGEHDVVVGKKRVQMEIERTREWQAEGIPVPPLVETTVPGVRVTRWLAFPSFQVVLADSALAAEHKLALLALVTRSLSFQHLTALKRDKKSLVHRDPGPWNIILDTEREVVYWCDLEHPADYPRMSLEALMVRGVRIFTFGVLDHLTDHFDDVIKTICDNYEPRSVLWKFVEAMEGSRASVLSKARERLLKRRPGHPLRRLLAPQIRAYLNAQEVKAVQGSTAASTGPRWTPQSPP